MSPGIVAHVYNHSTWETESRGLGVMSYRGLHKTLSQKCTKRVHICRLERFLSGYRRLLLLAKGQGLVPSPQMAAQPFVTPVTGYLIPSSGPCGHPAYTWYMYIHGSKILMHIKFL